MKVTIEGTPANVPKCYWDYPTRYRVEIYKLVRDLRKRCGARLVEVTIIRVVKRRTHLSIVHSWSEETHATR